MTQDRRTRRAKGPQPPLVAFDFDGTITVRDSFISFLKWRCGALGYALGGLRMAPTLVDYMVRRDRERLKTRAVREYLAGTSRDELAEAARTFAELEGPKLLRPDALAAWRRWRAEGARLVIVSASPDIVLAPFAEKLGADQLIATKLAYDSADRVTGALATPNCRGPEKIVRLKEAFGPDFALKAAYGDTSGDREMLSHAEIKGYKVFRGKP
jgi:phosphatidylglycerophosphatase C